LDNVSLLYVPMSRQLIAVAFIRTCRYGICCSRALVDVTRAKQ
jgi:hypothetical protein